MARIELEGSTRQYVLLGILLAIAVGVVFYQLRGGQGSGGGTHGRAQVEFKPHVIPELLPVATEQEAAAEAGKIRNPFVYGPPPTPTPNLTPPPTRPPVRTLPPRPTPTPNMIEVGGRRLPPPPPFDQELIGYFGPKERLVAVFRKGKALNVAVAGDVLEDTFVLQSVGLESVTIGFVGYPEEVTTRVPLAQKKR